MKPSPVHINIRNDNILKKKKNTKKNENILLSNQGPSRGNKLNYKYTYKGESVAWLIDSYRHNNTIIMYSEEII